ncbi:MAG: glycerol-3-phosphate dehydrogenase/oxidase [Bacteroidetes bacterium]|nr:glycerol-3-phosphate dehydrogenase/oxidase [Bacteroidota bacterium]
MKREHIINEIKNKKEFDIIVIGGGATGFGCAVDAANRGFSTLLLEQSDFGKGTSSKSTKLIHGGVRYLEQGNVALVIEALRERGILLKNAPHLISNLSFIIPNYSILNGPYFAIGLKMYDLLSGKRSFGASRWISQKATLQSIPNLKSDGLKSGITYHDGQFDDTRLIITLQRTLMDQGGLCLNYARFTKFIKDSSGKIKGVEFEDRESQEIHQVNAKVVINGSGIFATDIMQEDNPEHEFDIRPSQGSHIVVDRKFLPGDVAILIPKTPDGRVLFAIPWYGKVLIGTTDVAVEKHVLDPVPSKEEIHFILETVQRYLVDAPQEEDVLSAFAGLRPLVAAKSKKLSTKNLSRSHKVFVSESGLVTISGGKWTTYRKMAQETIDESIKTGNLKATPCSTEHLPLFGYSEENFADSDPLAVYGNEKKSILSFIEENPDMGERLHPEFPYLKAQVVWGCKYEMARTLEDVLARRFRILLLNAKAAIEAAPETVKIMDSVLKKGKNWQKQQLEDFKKQANNYLLHL